MNRGSLRGIDVRSIQTLQFQCIVNCLNALLLCNKKKKWVLWFQNEPLEIVGATPPATIVSLWLYKQKGCKTWEEIPTTCRWYLGLTTYSLALNHLTNCQCFDKCIFSLPFLVLPTPLHSSKTCHIWQLGTFTPRRLSKKAVWEYNIITPKPKLVLRCLAIRNL